MKRTGLLLAATLLAWSAHAAIVAGYDFDGGTLSPTTVDAMAAASAMTSPDFDDSPPNPENVLFVAEAQGLQNGTADNMAAAYAAGQYWEFTVTADPGSVLLLDSLTFDLSRSTRGVNDYAVRTSIDGYAANLVYQNQSINAGIQSQTINFNDPSDFTGLSGTNVGGNSFLASQFDGLAAITFRIVYDDRASNAGAASATRLDNLILNGSVVPEPSTYAAFGVLLVGCFVFARRSRRTKS